MLLTGPRWETKVSLATNQVACLLTTITVLFEKRLGRPESVIATTVARSPRSITTTTELSISSWPTRVSHSCCTAIGVRRSTTGWNSDLLEPDQIDKASAH